MSGCLERPRTGPGGGQAHATAGGAAGGMTQAGSERQPSPGRDGGPGRSVDLSDPMFDFAAPVPLRKSYIVASTPQAGGAFLCARLWQTGVLGAPCEYLGYPSGRVGGAMAKRVAAASHDDYLAKVLAYRTSPNGVFGVEVGFEDFEQARRRVPGLLNLLSTPLFIYVNRRDALAQAVAMVKAATPRYDRDLISKCLGSLERGRLGWRRWFAANAIEPLIVTYEELVDDEAAVVAGIIERLGVAGDEPEAVLHLMPTEEQGDDTGAAWSARFKREIEAGVEPEAVEPGPTRAPAAAAMLRAGGGGADAPAPGSSAEAVDSAAEPRPRGRGTRGGGRFAQRRDAIIGANRALFQDARVLETHSGAGRWSLAALAAGAAHVLGLEPRPRAVEAARAACAEQGASPETWDFVHSPDIVAAVAALQADACDLILCLRFSRLPDPCLCFRQFSRLRPRHVVLDTEIVEGTEPIARFRLEQPREGAAARGRSRQPRITAVPSHELIRLLCHSFGFGWRLIDWHGLGIGDWSGLRDYEGDRRRTYILDRLP